MLMWPPFVLIPHGSPVPSYTCGGVGHLSRDCVQGSKCYNCSGVVSFPQAFSLGRRFHLSFLRVISAGTAPSLKNVLVTLAGD
ncbi:hypothetical protein BDZ94DRAFT_1272808 [Collybia nuda]|uniref:CCHC-type domain-containing protein n=1 Tax=Collybia nuda TaxID=64659 RepID=A0A9P5XXN4_9AGAR|nr:hypothetical protein BDZ94DRAFT_1272808 [Collybia nuda]